MSYFEQRMQKLGITPELNKVMLLQCVKQKDGTYKNELVASPVFKQHEKGIEIPVYNLKRETIRVDKEGSRYKKDWSIIRLEKPITKSNGDTIKYLMPKGQGSFPFFPPFILDKFYNKTPIDCLYLTEGFFKAFVAGIKGIDMIGLPSITHLKEKDKGTLHSDILVLIKICNVKRVVWLTDGDCNDLTTKVEDKKIPDFYKRPASFFASISTFKQLLDDFDVEKYFMYPDSDAMVSQFKVPREEVKGIDDVIVSFPDKVEEIKADLCSVSKPGFWFQKFNITFGLGKVRDHFRLNNVNAFYLFHAERNEVIRNKEFIFHGTRYLYNEDKGECEVKIPAEAANYFRTGDDYYKFIWKPNKYKTLERIFASRRKGTINDDHGKKFFDHIPKYEAFCNVPDHVNFQQTIHSCFNVYNPLDHQPLEEECTVEDCPTIMGFMQHIFGTGSVHFIHPSTKEKKNYSNLELGLDYMQVLYQRPWEKLPILCLVSKENNTGKSTFGKLLKQIFSGNCAIVGNQDLAGDFNAHWSTKLLVICDETKIDKQTVVEKVKSLSTADKIMMNAKGKDHVEIDCFIKFIFITNNDENFIYVTDEDIRYWVMKVPVLKEENPRIMESMIEEIPAFLTYLNHRKMATEQLNRMWFHPSLLVTDALKKVQKNSQSTIVKELNFHITQKFLDFDLEILYMTVGDIRKEFFNNKYEANYVKKAIVEDLKSCVYHEFSYNNKFYATSTAAIAAALHDNATENELEVLRFIEKVEKTKRYSFPRYEFDAVKKEHVRVDISCLGRPYVFYRENFVTGNIELNPEQVAINGMHIQPGNEMHIFSSINDENAGF